MSIEDKTKDVQQLVVNQLGVANGLTDNNLADGQVTPAKLSTGHPNWDAGGNATITNNLTVNGDTDDGRFTLNKAVTGEGNATIDLHSTNATDDFDGRIASYSSGDMYIVNKRTDSPVYIATTNSANATHGRLKIQGDGNIGMGVGSPQEKLHLNGRIRVTNGASINGDDHTQGSIQLTNGNDSATSDHCLSLDPNEILCRQDLMIRVGRKTLEDGSENTTSAGGRNIRFQVKNPDGASPTNATTAIIRGDQHNGTFIVGRDNQHKYTGKTYFYNDTSDANVANNHAVSVFSHAQTPTGVTGDQFRIMQAFVVANNTVGYLRSTGNNLLLAQASDYRLKEDIVDLEGAVERVKQLKPRTFTWKSDGSSAEGFIAHELAEVCPEAVSGEKDGMRMEDYEVSPEVYDENGKIVEDAVMGTKEVEDYQTVSQEALIPILTKALQEALAKIESLEARVDALENA